jgi:hypothetical protein
MTDLLADLRACEDALEGLVASGDFTREDAGEWLDDEVSVIAYQLSLGRTFGGNVVGFPLERTRRRF